MDERKSRLIQFCVSVFVTLIVYYPTFVWMWERWFAEESYYGHGVLIPFISGYLIWQRKDLLKKVSISTNFWGLLIVALGLLIHFGCALLKIYFISGFSFVFVLLGLILFFFGSKMVKNLIFPIFLLFAMVPLPLVLVSNLTVKLKMFAAQCAAFILNRVGFPTMLDGNILRMPDSFTTVGAPCSGLRSLIALLTLGIIYSYSMKVSYIKKGILLLATMPLAMATNIMRITTVSIVNDLYGEKVAMGFFHDFMGFMVFFVAFIGLYAVGKMLDTKEAAVSD